MQYSMPAYITKIEEIPNEEVGSRICEVTFEGRHGRQDWVRPLKILKVTWCMFSFDHFTTELGET
jgi:hypothetical protein